MILVPGFNYHCYLFGESSIEKRRRVRVLRTLSLGREITPWVFIKNLEDDAIKALIEGIKGEIPGYISERYIEENLNLTYHRGVDAWNIVEKMIFDKNGTQMEREYFAAEFQVTPCWRGKPYPKEWIRLEWKDGEFSPISRWDIQPLGEIISENSEVPEGRGFQIEVEVD